MSDDLNKTFDLAMEKLFGNPADAKEDYRQQWSALNEDEKLDLAIEYMMDCSGLRSTRINTIVWKELWTENDTKEAIIDAIGRKFVKENDDEWCW